MMSANMIGFVVGVDGYMAMIQRLRTFDCKYSFILVLVVFVTLFGGVHRMFYHHDQEKILKSNLSNL
jgi:hypothetical protein